MNGKSTLFEFGNQVELNDELAERARRPFVDVAILRPVRTQLEMATAAASLDDRIAADHPVRAVWSIIEDLDLSAFDAQIDSTHSDGGRPAIDPRVLLALWVYAMSHGEGRASEIARRAQTDAVYQWIRGGVPVKERSLSGFRVSNEKEFDALATQIVGVIIDEDLAEVSRIAQDGTRVRASAGTGSFRRLGSLEAALAAAKQHLEQVRVAANDRTRSKTARAAAERGAREQVERIERARERVAKMGAERKLSQEEMRAKKGAPRASTTDPEATVMKMGDGGFRPAYNVQFATAADGSGVVVGVGVTQRGSDRGEATPMRKQVEARTGEKVKEQLVDAGYASHAEIQEASAAGTKLYAPLPKNLADPGTRRESEYSDASREWVERMRSDEGKMTYKKRGEVAELTNARAKSCSGLSMLLVRGVARATCCALLAAISIDVGRMIGLRAAAAQQPAPGAAPTPSMPAVRPVSAPTA